MDYRKINVELVVFADEANAVIAELKSAIDGWKRRIHFSAVTLKLSLSKKRAAAVSPAASVCMSADFLRVRAVKLAGDKIVGAYRKII